MSPAQRIERLREEIREHDRRYYLEDRPRSATDTTG
jgi:NAD-dependent DNA ligase